MQTSLIVATLKRLLPVGLNICAPGEQELIALAKNRFSQVAKTFDFLLIECVWLSDKNSAQTLLLSLWHKANVWRDLFIPKKRQTWSFKTCFYSLIFVKMVVTSLQQKDTEDEVREIIRSNLHLQGKVTKTFFWSCKRLRHDNSMFCVIWSDMVR